MVLPVAAVGAAGASAGKGATMAGIAASASAIAPYATIAGAGLSAIGAVSSGMQARQQGEYTANVLRQQADRERLDSAQREEDFRRQQSRLMGTRRALMGDSGVDPSQGSPLLVTEDMAGESELQALRIRSGGQATANRLEQEAELQRFKGRSDERAGFMRGGSLLVSGVGSAFGRRTLTV